MDRIKPLFTATATAVGGRNGHTESSDGIVKADLSVPKEMQRIGEAFYGRTRAYRTALASQDPGALTDAVARNIYENASVSRASASRLAAYMREAVRDLQSQPPAGLRAGQLRLPDPVAIPFVEDKSSGLED